MHIYIGENAHSAQSVFKIGLCDKFYKFVKILVFIENIVTLMLCFDVQFTDVSFLTYIKNFRIIIVN